MLDSHTVKSEKAGRVHYKHAEFKANIEAASGGLTLEEAAPQWEFSHFGEEAGDSHKHCELCHARIKKWVALKNTVNGVTLFIGHDCYDKFLRYLQTKEVKSVSLVGRSRYISEIKEYCADQHIDASFLAWCSAQNVPEFNDLLAFTKKYKYPPSKSAAEKLVLYYRANRRVKLRDLVGPVYGLYAVLEELGTIAGTELASKELTHDEFDALDLEPIKGLTSFYDLRYGGEFRRAVEATVPSVDMFAPGALATWMRAARLKQKERLDVDFKKAVVDIASRIAANQDAYRLLSFRKGINPKHGTEQWEARDGNGRKYILDRTSQYATSDGDVLCAVTRVFVEGRVFLVRKVDLLAGLGYKF